MKIVLTEVRGSARLSSHEFDQPTIKLGRDPALNDLAFVREQWPMVSRRHVDIEFRNGAWYLIDLGSVNGTYLNDERISQPVKLEPQSLIRLAHDGPALTVDFIEEPETAVGLGTLVDVEAASQQAALLAQDRPEQLLSESTPTKLKISSVPARSPKPPAASQTKTAAPPELGSETHVDLALTRLPANLVCESGSPAQLGQKYLLVKDQILIGRDPASHIAITDTTAAVSRRHAEVRRQPDGTFTIIDHSFNGTLVNNERITGSVSLKDGDRIQLALGGPIFRFSEAAVEQQQTKLAESTKATPPAAATAPNENFGMLTIFSRSAGATPVTTSTDHAQFLFERTFDGKQQLTVGRDAGNDIQLDGLLISKVHARLLNTAGQIAVEDMRSTNGLYVNGQRVTGSHTVQPEDVIQIGPFILRVTTEGQVAVFDSRAKTRIDAVGLSTIVRDSSKLLDDINLAIEPNEFVGVLGPSGAGKSTLLGALNGRRKPTAGKVLINNLELYHHLDSLKQWIGYVPQDDIIHRELTVYRTLYYVARLRLSRDVPRSEIDQIISEVLDVTGLADRRDVTISLLSGGQRKRVSIAVELITKPSLIFLDEPTSGLDPATEQRMMKLFRQIAESGRTVVLTTHAMENVALFDRVAVLMHGKLIFYGTPNEALEFVDAKTFIDLYNKLEAPVEAELSTTSPLPPTATRQQIREFEGRREEITAAVAADWQTRFRESALYEQYIKQPLANVREEPPAPAPRRGQRSLVDGIRQWRILVGRYLRVLASDRFNLFVLFAQAPIIATLTYLVVGKTDSRDFVYFILSLVSIWFGTSVAARELVKERPIFERERMVNLRLLPYLASKLFILSLIVVLQTLLLFVTAKALHYSGLLFLPGVLFGLPHFGTLALTAIVGIAVGLFVSALVRTSEVATSLVPLVLIPQILFAGLVTVPTGLTRIIGATMPATWSFDEMKRLSTLDTLKSEGADPNGPTKGQGLYQHTKDLNAEKFAKARTEMDDYRERMADALSLRRSPSLNRNAPETAPSPPPIPSPEEINDNLSHYVTFKHPWGGRIRDPAILFLMLVTLSIATLIVLRAKDIR